MHAALGRLRCISERPKMLDFTKIRIQKASVREEFEIYLKRNLRGLDDSNHWRHFYSLLGIQIRNMKMVFNIYGTWRQVTFEKLMMKIYDFFYSAKSFSHLV